MRTFYLLALLVVSLAGPSMAQQSTARLTEPGVKRTLSGLSHIEVDLGQRNTLVIGFDRYAQVRARQNVDSVLRLFVVDYRAVDDTTQSPVQTTHALFRLGETDRTLDLHHTLPSTTSFSFRGAGEPIQLKTRQDTLQMIWSSATSRSTPYDFSIYLFVNNLSDVEGLLKSGGINQKIQTALESVRQYSGHDLTDPKMSFDMVQSVGKAPTFLNPGLAKSPFISLQPGIGVGLIRNQWVPSLNFDAQFIPSRLHNVGYLVGYTSNFFFQPAADGRFSTFRNDFLRAGVAFYHRNKDGRTVAFNRQIASFYVGVPVYRRGNYFDRNALQLGGTVYQNGLFKVQPELNMSGFFKRVYPGLRLVIGL
ncbi:MAG: hypothetical protein H7Z72_10645 [Bacteroidetes bacterium]|nr:hypothetical protein [Fibrella sp.]